MPFFAVTVGASCVFMVSHQLVFRSAGVARYGYLELPTGGASLSYRHGSNRVPVLQLTGI
jgi:hypothetical protein